MPEFVQVKIPNPHQLKFGLAFQDTKPGQPLIVKKVAKTGLAVDKLYKNDEIYKINGVDMVPTKNQDLGRMFKDIHKKGTLVLIVNPGKRPRGRSPTKRKTRNGKKSQSLPTSSSSSFSSEKREDFKSTYKRNYDRHRRSNSPVRYFMKSSTSSKDIRQKSNNQVNSVPTIERAE